MTGWTVGAISSIILIIISLYRLGSELNNIEYISYFEVAWQDSMLKNKFLPQANFAIICIYICVLFICLYLFKVYISVKIIEGSTEHRERFFEMVFVPFQIFEWILRLVIVLYLILGISGHEWFVSNIDIKKHIDFLFLKTMNNSDYKSISNTELYLPLVNILVYSISIYLLLILYSLHLYVSLLFSKINWYLRRKNKLYDSLFKQESYWNSPKHAGKDHFIYYSKRFFLPNLLGIVLLLLILVLSCIKIPPMVFTTLLGVLTITNAIILIQAFFKKHGEVKCLSISFLSLFFEDKKLETKKILKLWYVIE